MATRVFDGIKFCEHFWRGPPKEHSCQVWSKLALRFGRRRCLKKLFTTDTSPPLKLPLSTLCSGELKKALRWLKAHTSFLKNKLFCLFWNFTVLRLNELMSRKWFALSSSEKIIVQSKSRISDPLIFLGSVFQPSFDLYSMIEATEVEVSSNEATWHYRKTVYFDLYWPIILIYHEPLNHCYIIILFITQPLLCVTHSTSKTLLQCNLCKIICILLHLANLTGDLFIKFLVLQTYNRSIENAGVAFVKGANERN